MNNDQKLDLVLNTLNSVILDEYTEGEKIGLLKIISELNKFKNKQPSDYLTESEKFELSMVNLKKYIVKNYDDDDDFRGSVENQGTYYFYYNYDTIPNVSFEHFKRYIDSDISLL